MRMMGREGMHSVTSTERNGVPAGAFYRQHYKTLREPKITKESKLLGPRCGTRYLWHNEVQFTAKVQKCSQAATTASRHERRLQTLDFNRPWNRPKIRHTVGKTNTSDNWRSRDKNVKTFYLPAFQSNRGNKTLHPRKTNKNSIIVSQLALHATCTISNKATAALEI